jgi:hypothetical protein
MPPREDVLIHDEGPCFADIPSRRLYAIYYEYVYGSGV